MKRSDWLNGLRTGRRLAPQPRGSHSNRRRDAGRPMSFEILEERALLAADFGDAPDLGAGTGPGNYNTLLSDNGPRHTIVAGLKLGANVDGDGGTLQNTAANADDVNGALPIDEDGLANPAVDLVLTVGTQPKVNVRATNTTGTAATLYGWIDDNANGVFDNATERASVAVPDGTNGGIMTLVFPTVPSRFAGTTYARFRLSTDVAAANPTGVASDGEVEDYRVTITKPTSGTADSAKTVKIASGSGPTLADGDVFGSSAASLGDLDGDGVPDLAVGAIGDSTFRGAVHVLFMNANGTVKSSQKIASDFGGGPTLGTYDGFGRSLAALGDLNGDGVPDLAVGAYGDGTGVTSRGAVYVQFMNANGTVKSSQKIASDFGGGPTLGTYDGFGRSVASLGDLDGDGVPDLAVGASGDNSYRGAVHVLFMNANGTVKSSQKIASDSGGGPTLADGDYFGSSVAALGDLDGDGVTDLAVGAIGDSTGPTIEGALYVLFMNGDGTVKSRQKIAGGIGGGPTLAPGDFFGISVASMGDLDGDGIMDLTVGASGDDTGRTRSGAVHVLFMNANGTVKRSQKIASNTGGGPTLASTDLFGSSVATLGDLNGDGLTDIAVGAEGDDTGGTNRGAVYVLFLKPANLAGDYNLNGTVDAADYTLWRDTLGAIVTPFSGADGSGNGVVDQADYDVWKAHFGQTANNLPGDFNHNNVVDAADYTVWRDALGSATDLRANGDNTGPSAGVIDQADYDTWKTHFGQTLSGSGAGSDSAAGLDASASLQSVAASDPVTASQPPALLARGNVGIEHRTDELRGRVRG